MLLTTLEKHENNLLNNFHTFKTCNKAAILFRVTPHVYLMQLFLCFLFIISFLLIFFFPTDPCINTSLHTFILHSLPLPQCCILRLVFIFLSRSRGLYLQKRAQIKEHHNSCEDDGPFCLSLCIFFLWTVLCN